jgi:hypothetical protein
MSWTCHGAVSSSVFNALGAQPRNQSLNTWRCIVKKTFALPLAALASVLAISLTASPASAQASRTWVSGVGDDANPCSRTAPCKTFAGAISKTAVNGEINCLDPGGFGAVTITKSITLDCHEVFASILVAGTNAINIPFDSFTDTRKTVNIRNLNLQGFDSGLVAINITGSNAAGSMVNVEDCLINGFFGGNASGILEGRNAGGLKVSNTTIRDLGGNGISAGGAIKIAFSHVKIANATFGVVLGPGVAMQISQSIISNSGTGLFVASGAQMSVDSTVISNNTTGINSSGGTIRLSNSDISFNTTGMSGTVQTFSNNRFTSNGAGGALSPIGSTSNPTGQQ